MRADPIVDQALAWLGIVLIAVVTTGSHASDDVPARSGTNFVIILCDDLGSGDLGCYGHPVIQTPNLDRLAAEGMRFTDCYAAAPVCSPARAGMLTGRNPYRSGIIDWIPDGSPMHLRAREVTVAALLKQAGYATCFSGKWHCNGRFNSPDQPQPVDHGFDHWFATQNNAIPSHRNPRNFVRNGRAVGPIEGYSSTIIMNEAITWLERRESDRPFCLLVWFHSPHEPIATDEAFVEPYRDEKPRERAIYYGNVTQMDHEVGRLLESLDRFDLRDRTFVLFTSDNGPETLNRYRGAQRSYGSPGKLRGMKLHLYEGGIRVPGIIRWPGRTRPGQVCREPVCGVDLLPTLCEVAGVEVERARRIDGTSFLPIFENESVERQTPLYWRYDRAISEPKVALRDGDFKLLADADLTHPELYDLREDPSETTNLVDRAPRRLERMMADLQRLHAEIEAERPEWPDSARRGETKSGR